MNLMGAQVKNRTQFGWVFSLCLSIFLPLHAVASPHRSLAPESAAVYTKPYASIPTGHYSVNTLSKRLVRKENFNWVFVKDLQTGKMGWTPRDQLLSPLHFSTKARLLAGSPVFRTRSDRRPTPELMPAEEVTVQLLSIESEWVQVQGEQDTFWVHNSYLLPVEKDPGYFYAKFNSVLKSNPRTKSSHVLSITAGQRLTPLKVNRDWVMVGVGNKKGYLPINQIVHRIHVANKVKTDDGLLPAHPDMIHEKIFAVYVDPLWLGTGVHSITLYSQPSMTGNETAIIPPWMSLQQQEASVQEWSLSQMDGIGPVWWQHNTGKTNVLQWKELAKGSFRSIIHNPLFPSSRIGLADTLYRSNDGVNWGQVRGVFNHNPAFAYSRDGILFIDDKISMDNGETLHPFVFWEAVLNRLRVANIGVAENVKILNIYALNESAQKIIYEIDVGGQRPVKVYTPDRGRTWALYR